MNVYRTKYDKNSNQSIIAKFNNIQLKDKLTTAIKLRSKNDIPVLNNELNPSK